MRDWNQVHREESQLRVNFLRIQGTVPGFEPAGSKTEMKDTIEEHRTELFQGSGLGFEPGPRSELEGDWK